MSVIGVDVGGTRVRASGGRTPSSDPVTVPTPPHLDDLLGAITSVVGTVAGEDEIDAIGVACAGLVDHPRGILRWMPHRPGGAVEIAASLDEVYGAPVWVDNDANAATLGEARIGAGVGHRMVLGVFVGTGIGAGLVIEGRIERGRGHLGEVGHMYISDGPECGCGRIGCWEVFASGRALDRRASEWKTGASGPELVDAARRGSEEAQVAVSEVGRWLGIGLANLILVLDPDVVVVGGLVAEVGELLLEPARAEVAAAGGGLEIAGAPPVVTAALGTGAALEGAIIGAKELMP